MQIPILNGVYTDNDSDYRTSYPRNLIPIVKNTGISNGYLRPAEGIVQFGDYGPGVDRGGINWDEECFRVMGGRLVRINADGTVTDIAAVGSDGNQVTLDYSFDFLITVSNGNLFYTYKDLTTTQVTDPDLGTSIDAVFIDGYVVSTDGEFLVLSEITSPTSFDPFDYISSERDPDPIVGVLKLRNELYAVNRYSIESFRNVGGSGGAAFQRIDGAQITRGSTGTHAHCVFLEAIAFVGNRRDEAVSVWIGKNGVSNRISTREIDQILETYTVAELEAIVLEPRYWNGHQHLWIRLPDKTLVYDANASNMAGQPVWYKMTSSISGDSRYLGQNLVYCYDKWLVSHPTDGRTGELVENVSSHWGESVGWDFDTLIIYNESKGALFHELELVALTGRTSTGNPLIFTRFSNDGLNYSDEISISAGTSGQTTKRLAWINQGFMENYRIQRFRGTSTSHLALSRLEVALEPLYV